MNWKFWTWFTRRTAPSVANERRVFTGDGTWPFYVTIDGDDAVMRATLGRKLTATWFGGDDDKHDDGRTASGIMTRGNPGLLGCALPMQISNGVKVHKCAGSPIHNIPYGAQITVTAGNVTLTAPLIDVGPAKWTSDSVDLTQAAFRKFSPLHRGSFRVDSVRIHDGAKYFK